MAKKNPHAVALGRKGGLAKSERKRLASRKNGLIGAIRKKLRKELDMDKQSA